MILKVHKASSTYTVFTTVGCAMALSLVLILVGTPLHAASPNSDFTMQVRPRLCVLSPDEVMCTMQFAVTWSAATATDVCLTFAGELEALRCWQQEREGQFEMKVERRQSALVQLREANSDTLLLEEQIPIISRDKRDTRSRRRHAWSIL